LTTESLCSDDMHICMHPAQKFHGAKRRISNDLVGGGLFFCPHCLEEGSAISICTEERTGRKSRRDYGLLYSIEPGWDMVLLPVCRKPSEAANTIVRKRQTSPDNSRALTPVGAGAIFSDDVQSAEDGKSSFSAASSASVRLVPHDDFDHAGLLCHLPLTSCAITRAFSFARPAINAVRSHRLEVAGGCIRRLTRIHRAND
jgi:hypothetical protein